MQISFILPNANLGGGTRVIAIYAQQLKRMGHTIRIISTPPSDLTLRDKFRYWVRGNGWPKVPSRYASHLYGTELDHHVIDRWRPITDDDVPDGDIVIATWWETAEWIAALSARKGAKVYFIQAHEVHKFMPEARVRATYRLPFHKIVIAQGLQRVMSEQYGDAMVDVVPNSVDPTQFFAPVRGKQPAPSVGFLYASSDFKGLDTTLAALEMLGSRIPNVGTISFGAQRPIRSLPLPRGVEFFHMPPQHEIRNLYARCDAWVTASRRNEGFNLPALEAMACRTPVVSTRAAWPEEAIKSGWNGVLVDVDDVQGLTDGLEWVLSRSDQEWRNLSANAYATAAAAGSWETSAKLFEKALEHACRRSMRGEIGGKCSMGSKN